MKILPGRRSMIQVCLQGCLSVLLACGCTKEEPAPAKMPIARDRAPAQQEPSIALDNIPGQGLPVAGGSPLVCPATNKPPKAYCNVDTVFAEPELAQCRHLKVVVKGEGARWPKGEIEAAFKKQFSLVFAEQGVTFAEGGAGESTPAVDAVVSLESYIKELARPGPDSIDARPTVLTIAIADAKSGIVLASVVITDEYSEASASDMYEKALKALKTQLEKAGSK